METEIFFYFIVPSALVYSGWAVIYSFEKMESGNLAKIRAIYNIIAISVFWLFVLALYMKYNEHRNFSEKIIENAEILEIISHLCFLIAGIVIKSNRYYATISLLMGYAMMVYLS